MDQAVRRAFEALDVEDLLGIVALWFVQYAHSRRIGGEFVDQFAIFGGRNDVAGDRRSRDDMLRREGNRLHDTRAFRESEIDVAHVHEVHRRRREVLDLHDDLTLRALSAKDDTRRGAVVRAEAHRIVAGASHRHPRAARVGSAGNPGFVHIRAGRLAMESMGVAGAGNAVAQKPGVIGKTPVRLDDDLGRARRRKHALHREFDAIERRAPNHLTHKWAASRHDRARLRDEWLRRLCQNGRCWRATRRSARPLAPSLRNSRAARRIQRLSPTSIWPLLPRARRRRFAQVVAAHYHAEAARRWSGGDWRRLARRTWQAGRDRPQQALEHHRQPVPRAAHYLAARFPPRRPHLGGHQHLD